MELEGKIIKVLEERSGTSVWCSRCLVRIS